MGKHNIEAKVLAPFSVLMSLYNKENASNLKSCLTSLVEQTVNPSEVIMVYDGEIDEDLDEVVNRYQTTLNIKIIKLEHNVGLGNALNIGIMHCSYRIVARMDTDDICMPTRFEKQVKYFVDNDLDLLGSGIIEFEPNGSRRLKILPTAPSQIGDFIKFKNPFNHMTVIFNKDVVEAVGGYQHHMYMEDYNLWIRIFSAKYKIENITDILVEARVDKNMLLRRRGWTYVKSEILLMKLKMKHKITSAPTGVIIFLMRTIPRIMPLWVLQFLYSKDRKKVE